MANKRGRPRKLTGQAKNEILIIRLASDEKEAFAAASELAGQDLSVWVCARLRQSARKELEKLGEPVAFLRGAVRKNEEQDVSANGRHNA